MKRKIESSVALHDEVLPKKAARDGGFQQAHSASKNTSLYRPPTREEINTLKETENLFKSSLFRMQISELLEEVQPKKQKSKAVDEVLHELNTFLKSLSRGKECDLSDNSWLSKKVQFPLPPPPSEVRGKFHFVPPSLMNVVGSYMLGTMTKPDFTVDVTMEMPQECFQAKDFLNMRYHHKRALYLTVVASKLVKSKMFASVNFTHFNGELLKPILLLKPKGKAGKKYTIKLFPVLPDGVFKLPRFSPDKNNIRCHWFEGRENDSGVESDTGPPTSHYNSSILSDCLMQQHLHHLYQCITDCPLMRDAVILINVWLQQRELSRGQGMFSSFLVAMVVSHLFTSRKINSQMSSYQILRIFLQFIGSTDWTETGIQMRKEQNDEKLPLLSDFHSAFDVVFIDPSGYLNICANMSKYTYFRVKHEAKLAMEFLDSRFLDGFEVMFMRKVPFIQTFDQYFCLSSVSCLGEAKDKPEPHAHILSRGGDWVPAVSNWIIDLLKKGLGKRIELIGFKSSAAKEWSVKESPPSLSCDRMMVGLMLDPHHSDKVLDTGPPANDPQAAQFRAFWGGKSELRRFQDGSILEAVVWSCRSIAERRVICNQVIKHILQRHGNIDPSEVHFIANQLDPILQDPTTKTSTPTKDKSPGSQKLNSMETGEESMQKVMTAYDSLCKQIRSLELPLAVHSLQGISPVFRGAEVFPPSPCHKNAFKPKQQNSDKENGKAVAMATNVSIPKHKKAPLWCPVAEVLLQFETSGKWPDNLVAIQHIKAAFHVKLAELLSSSLSLQCVATPEHVDVLKNGFGFRVKIAHYREMVLLQQSISSDESEEKEVKEKLTKMEREIVHLPVLTTTLHSVEQQFNAYSGTVRLAKRWVSAHLLLSHMPSECIELLVAYLFLSPAPFKAPRSPLVGFLRFLHFISTCDWKTNPIIVNLNNDLTAEDYQEISTKFSIGRFQLPPLFISTPKDKFDSKWTKEAPTKQILRRMEILAKESYSVLLNQLDEFSSQEADFKQIFRPPIADYDVIIRLKHHCIPRYYQSVDFTKSQNEQHDQQRGSGMPVLAFDPVQGYITELKESFSDIAMFLHDNMGGDFIAVVWKPHAFEKHPFKVVNAQYKILVEGKAKKSKNQQALLAPNTEAIIQDFSLLGKGMVERIVVKNGISTETHTIKMIEM